MNNFTASGSYDRGKTRREREPSETAVDDVYGPPMNSGGWLGLRRPDDVDGCPVGAYSPGSIQWEALASCVGCLLEGDVAETQPFPQRHPRHERDLRRGPVRYRLNMREEPRLSSGLTEARAPGQRPGLAWAG